MRERGVRRRDFARARDLFRSAGDPPACRTVQPRAVRRSDGSDRSRGRRSIMVRRYNRLLVLFHILSDALLAISAFVLAYALRFQTGLIPITKGTPPLRQYINILPFIAALVPIAFNLQGLYRLRRGRSRVDD